MSFLNFNGPKEGEETYLSRPATAISESFTLDSQEEDDSSDEDDRRESDDENSSEIE